MADTRPNKQEILDFLNNFNTILKNNVKFNKFTKSTIYKMKFYYEYKIFNRIKMIRDECKSTLLKCIWATRTSSDS